MLPWVAGRVCGHSQVVFIGDHSHGVSSVLQSMLGLRFLPDAGDPRNTDTRDRQLVLAKPLSIRIASTTEAAPYVRFGDGGAPKITDFTQAARHIATHLIPFPRGGLGTDGGPDEDVFADATALEVTLYSPVLPEMTVVMLPGLCAVRALPG